MKIMLILIYGFDDFKYSMKKTALILGSMLLSSAVLANQAEKTATEEQTADEVIAAQSMNITTRNELMGLWGMQIPKNKQCVEYYNFNTASTVIIQSDQEWSMGQYQYQLTSDDQLPILLIQIKHDNNEKDCSGVQEDQTGDLQQFFVKWHSSDEIEFCAGSKGENCFARLERIRP